MDVGDRDRTRSVEWRLHWPVVLVGAAGMIMASAPLYSLGIFIAPLQEEFGWSRLQITAGHTIVSVMLIFLAPFVGMLVDKIGPRRVGLPGSILFCITLAMLSMATPSIWSWWILWACLALGMLGVSPVIWTSAVARSFSRSRGLALAITLSGTGLSLAIAPNLTRALVEHFGWRGGYLGLSAFLAIVVVPLVFLFPKAANHNQTEGRGAISAHRPAALSGMAWREALISMRFAKLAIASLFFALCAVSFSINLVPILSANGLSRETAAAMAVFIGSGSIIGRLSTGFLLDRYNGNIVGAAAAIAPIFGCLCLILAPGSIYLSAIGTFGIGLALGAEYDVMAYLATRHFGVRSFGLIFAMINVTIGVASGIGPAIFSHIFDQSGSYLPALWASIPLYMLAAAALLTLGPYLREEDASPQPVETPKDELLARS